MRRPQPVRDRRRKMRPFLSLCGRCAAPPRAPKKATSGCRAFIAVVSSSAGTVIAEAPTATKWPGGGTDLAVELLIALFSKPESLSMTRPIARCETLKTPFGARAADGGRRPSLTGSPVWKGFSARARRRGPFRLRRRRRVAAARRKTGVYRRPMGLLAMKLHTIATLARSPGAEARRRSRVRRGASRASASAT